MPTLDPQTLWSDSGRTRFFLIPDQEQLPPGDFPIHTLTGRKLTVNSSSLAGFEVTEDEAKKWLETQFGNMLDSARREVERFVDRLAGADKDPLMPIRNALETLEGTLNRYESSHKRDTETSANALERCAARLSELADRMLSLAKRYRS